MNVTRIDFYSGMKFRETPRIIHTDTSPIEVAQIIERKLEEDAQSGERNRVFLFKNPTGNIFKLSIRKDKITLNRLRKKD